MYGDEEEGVPPSELFQKTDAEKALRDAEKTLSTKLLTWHDPSRSLGFSLLKEKNIKGKWEKRIEVCSSAGA